MFNFDPHPGRALSIARQESRYDPSVKSPSAARGLLQFISSTGNQIAAQLNLRDFDQNDLYQPERAILIGSLGAFGWLFLMFVRFLPAISISEMRKLVLEKKEGEA